MKKFLIVLTVLSMSYVADALALSSYLTSFNNRYGTSGTRLDTCILCHPNYPSSFSRNSYGSAFQNNSHNYQNIENLDSDNDSFTNLQEINALTFPGNASDFPIASLTPNNPSNLTIN